MWICLNDAFLSIVKNSNDDETLLVRARSQEHFDNVFPDCHSWFDGYADYPIRAYIERDLVAKVIGQSLMDIQYPNFKSSVKEDNLLRAYHRVWGIMKNHFDNSMEKLRQTTLDEFEE
ncbi:MAG: hypothetical protein ACTSVR_06970 [Candidatus Thorarchaeota archaeon]|jgi:hypothetical protein